MKKVFDFTQYKPTATVKMGGHVYVEWRCHPWLKRLVPLVNRVFKPKAVHEPTKWMLAKEDGIYELKFDEDKVSQ